MLKKLGNLMAVQISERRCPLWGKGGPHNSGDWRDLGGREDEKPLFLGVLLK